MTLLKIRNLRTHLRTDEGLARAVDGVDLEVQPGEAVGIVGESGSGKTQLALSILGLLPEGGREIQPGSSILFKGEELVGMKRRALRRIRGRGIGMVFQEPASSLNPVFSVGSQLSEVLRRSRNWSRGRAWKEAVALLEEVGIPAPDTRAKDYPHQLSGGMRQRVMIALALAGDPDLLVADEPTTALDPTVQVEILRLLDNLRRDRGMSIVLISHDLAVVGEVCERVMVMYGGQVIESGPVERILRIPAHPYTQGLLESRVPAEKGGRRLFSIPGEVPEAAVWPEGCRFHPRCSEALDHCSTKPPEVVSIPESEDHDFGWARCWLLDNSGDTE